MTRPGAVLVLLCAGALLGGCALGRSKSARTYVLDPVAVQPAPALAPIPVAVVGVEAVDVPDWLARPQLTGRAASGEVVSDEFSRWGEPLARGVQRVVTENLTSLLPDRRVLAAPFPPRETADHRVTITVVEAARQPDGAVLLEARFEVLEGRERVLIRRRSSHRAAPTAAGASGAVAGVSEALAALSREIAEILSGLAPPAR
jgi:uncharacterized lipoprotein YmbA